MQEFLQTYGIYLTFGLLILVMVSRRGKAGGCCGGGHGQEPGSTDKNNKKTKGSCH